MWTRRLNEIDQLYCSCVGIHSAKKEHEVIICRVRLQSISPSIDGESTWKN